MQRRNPASRVLVIAALLGASCGDPATSSDAGADIVQIDDTDSGATPDDARDGGDDPGLELDTAPDTSGTALDGETCDGDRDCASGVCLRVDASLEVGFCTGLCVDADSCDEGWDCVLLANSGGDAVRLCIPQDLCIDRDGDGYGFGTGCEGLDCDDADENRNFAATEICDGVDNDCDGFVDDSTVEAGRDCETGFAGTCSSGIGACVGGIVICETRTPASREVCDGLDNDCDGAIDEGDDGEALTEACYGGRAATLGIGQCVAGTRTCVDGELGDCEGQVLPYPELCDHIDNDCDGAEDEGAIGNGVACDTGLAGICARGQLSCGDDSACIPLSEPQDEVCDGLDNDCDGQTDEDDLGDSLTRTCYTGPSETLGVGQCQEGTETCVAGRFASCQAQVTPTIEVCDGFDNDCDGDIDDGDPDGGETCDSGLRGACRLGRSTCADGVVMCVARAEPSDERCDGVDNDCDGMVDEDLAGQPMSRTCYEGDAATLGVGVCVAGAQQCSGGEFGACIGDVTPSVELCDGADNDCDGDEDEDAIGGAATCATGLPGVCSLGIAACAAGTSSGCLPIVAASPEVCDGLDNDCDGLVDEDDGGDPLARDCYTGPSGTAGVGECVAGMETCVGGRFSACLGQVTPVFETCDGLDDDCDGAADDGDPGAGASCDTGGLGACRAGASSCLDGALACIPRATSTAERCDGVDNDCDGLVDEDEAGAPLARSCYEGDASTLGVGVCVAGVQSCGGGEFGACIGDVTPSVELCDGADNDCDGEEDEDVVDGASTCATGLPGVCALGIASCIGGASSGCVPVVSPSAEVCDGLDNDCDGLVDEDEAGDPLSRACYTGPAGTAGVGECSGGTESCVAGQYSACLGQVTPRFEVCDGLDNDCDGTADDGNPEGGALCDTDGVGACRPGTSSCVGGALVCTPRTTASTEQCDGIDNDCDGAIDENEAGGPLSRACYDGPAGTSGVGVCHGGAQVCMDGDFGSCTGDVVPTIEVCDGLDNDCDGGEDEDVVVSTSVCSTGLSGACAIGVLECVDGGEQCTPVFAPGVEVCDGLDNDCDGLIDETAAGDPLSRACYTGPTGTAGVGECAAGLEVCQTGQYTSCQGQVTPQFETCDGLDNDCDGAPDDGNPGGGALCDTGLQGICAQGVASCVGGAVECTQRFAATTETCDGFDNDCDGVVDEDIAGDPLTRSCYDGPSDTLGVGQCRAGTATCRFGDWGGCAGQIIPLGEVCDFEDNDCDGDTDEGVQLAFFLDADLDGYGDPDTIVMACFGDGYVTNGLDCYDSNPQANPEQAGYFATDRGDGSFDYNCDGDEDGFYTGYGSCQSSPPLCYLAEEGWSSTAAIPDCGVSGTYIFDCLGNGANCNPTTAATVQRCH